MAAFRYQFGASPPLSADDYRALAQRKLPKMAWAYIEGAADDLVTVTDNRRAFRRWRLRQRSLAGVTQPDLSADVAGCRIDIPVALAPTGIIAFAHWQADLAAARGAERAGTRHVLSTGSSYSLEEVAEATEHDHWFQLYPYGDRTKVGELLDRAGRAGFTHLFVTVDVPVRGNREVERRAGMTVPPTLNPSRVLDAARHPYWWWNLLKHKRVAPIHYGTGPRGLAAAVEALRRQERYMQSDLCWDDIAWMRERWKGPLYVKGVLDPEDAARCAAMGCEGVVVSNHGGRQLDYALGALDALPPIVDAVAGRCEVLLDGGVRRGAEVLIALALGAKAVMIGRPYAYGLAAAGEAGVVDVLRILTAEMQRAMVLMGCPSVAALDRSWVIRTEG